MYAKTKKRQVSTDFPNLAQFLQQTEPFNKI